MIKSLKFFLPMIVLPFIASCVNGSTSVATDSDTETGLSYATNLKISRHDGYDLAIIRNPWDTTRILHTYILVPDSVEYDKSSFPAGTVVRVPVKNAVVYSAVHIGLFDELGASDAVKGVCDTDYLTDSVIKSRIKNGYVVDCGKSTSPSIEKIISLQPDAIFLSPYENSGSYGKLAQTGIAVIECADYMESTPLGRAEWMKFFGLLTGKVHVADSLFNAVESEYNAVKELVSQTTDRPGVLTDMMYGSVWFVPGRKSGMSHFITDAGGRNAFDSYDSDGTVSLSAEKVLVEAGDADVWLIRYFQDNELTRSQLEKENPIYGKFAAFSNNNVYGCNTSRTDYYDRIPFHPEILLKDLVGVIHPELRSDSVKPLYFHKLK